VRRARIVCTIGPASGTPDLIGQLVKAGMNVARLNMSHGTIEDHMGYIRAVRAVSDKLQSPVAILLDLQGIKIRISDITGETIHLKKGQEVQLRSGNRPSTSDTLYISFPSLLRDVRKGHRVLLDDGLLELVVTGREGNSMLARVREGGSLVSRKGVNLPDSRIKARTFTGKDRHDLEFGIREGVDAVALSFVTRSEDVIRVKRKLQRSGSTIPVIAKIEKPTAVDRIDQILEVADGIMVARGDLGVEGLSTAVPMIQKSLIRKANAKQKLVITATQMLESMRTNPVPTRAETADVANAILDGSDAVMLSGETSVGQYPIRTVRTMARIIEETERGDPSFRDPFPMPEPGDGEADGRTSFAVADAAVRAAADVKARCIVAFTRSGYTAGLLAKLRPDCPIIAFTPARAVINRMILYWGVLPYWMGHLEETDKMVTQVERALLDGRHARQGDIIVITASLPMQSSGKTNFMKVHRIKKAQG
jgi:pyruvate kinase